MNKYIYLILAVCSFHAFFCHGSFAQTAIKDTGPQQVALKNAVALYNSSQGAQAPIFTGPEYYPYDPHIKGTAYYLEINSFTLGTVYYDGILYQHINMLYDINLDEVAVLLPNNVSRLSLLKERVKSFDFAGSHFINVNADTLKNNTTIKSGYYRQLYNGPSELLGKYSKTIQTSTSTAGIENYFSASKEYYIKKNNTYHSMSGSQGALLDALKDKKKQLKQYIKANNIVYKENPEEAMVKIVNYYDHLSQ